MLLRPEAARRRRWSGVEWPGESCAPVCVHGLSRDGPWRLGHTRRWHAAVRQGGGVVPEANSLGEHAREMEQGKEKVVAVAVGLRSARRWENGGGQTRARGGHGGRETETEQEGGGEWRTQGARARARPQKHERVRVGAHAASEVSSEASRGSHAASKPCAIGHCCCSEDSKM